MERITVDDVIMLWRPLNAGEIERAEALIPLILDSLREEARRVGEDLDELAKNCSYFHVLKSVVVDVTARTLMTSTEQEPMVQSSESALGYSWSGTFLVPGGGLFIKRTELARLGLRKQKYGVIDFYGKD